MRTVVVLLAAAGLAGAATMTGPAPPDFFTMPPEMLGVAALFGDFHQGNIQFTVPDWDAGRTAERIEGDQEDGVAELSFSVFALAQALDFRFFDFGISGANVWAAAVIAATAPAEAGGCRPSNAIACSEHETAPPIASPVVAPNPPGPFHAGGAHFQPTGLPGSTEAAGPEAEVPEPGSLLLAGAGFLGLGLLRRRFFGM